MTTHETLIKNIHTNFKNSWTYTPIHFDSSEQATRTAPYISLRYTPMRSAKETLGIGDSGNAKKGLLRVFIYEKNPTTAMIMLDKVITFLKDKTLYSVRYTEGFEYSSAKRSENGDFYLTFVDFEVCSI